MQDNGDFQVAATDGQTFCYCIGLIIQLLSNLFDPLCYLRIDSASFMKRPVYCAG